MSTKPQLGWDTHDDVSADDLISKEDWTANERFFTPQFIILKFFTLEREGNCLTISRVKDKSQASMFRQAFSDVCTSPKSLLLTRAFSLSLLTSAATG